MAKFNLPETSSYDQLKRQSISPSDGDDAPRPYEAVPSYLSNLMPVRPLPPISAPANEEFLAREERLTKREEELGKREQNVLILERELELRSKELDAREEKLKQWEESLRKQKRNQIQVLTHSAKFELPQSTSYNTEKVRYCQRFLKRCMHRKKLLRGEAKPTSMQEVIRLVQVNDWDEKKRNHHYWRALSEILQTEEGYVRDLGLVVDHYLQPLYSFTKTSDIQQIFGNLSELWAINTKLLANLRTGFYQKESADVRLSDAFALFLQHLPAMYTDYYVNFDNSNELRQKLKANSKYNAYLEDLRNNSPNPALDLDSYLIKPIQRLPRYKLLLEAVTKLMPDTHKLRPALIETTKEIDTAIININEFKREEENKKHVALLAHKLQCPPNFTLVEPHRRVVHHSPLCIIPPKENSKHVWKTGRFGYLFNDVLLASKSRVLSSSQTVICIIDLKEAMTLRDLKDTDDLWNCFAIEQGEICVYMITETVESKTEWFNHLKRTVASLNTPMEIEAS